MTKMMTWGVLSKNTRLLCVIESDSSSIFLSISTIFPLLPHLERHFLYLVPRPNTCTVHYLGESHIIYTLVYKDVSSHYQIHPVRSCFAGLWPSKSFRGEGKLTWSFPSQLFQLASKHLTMFQLFLSHLILQTS